MQLRYEKKNHTTSLCDVKPLPAKSTMEVRQKCFKLSRTDRENRLSEVKPRASLGRTHKIKATSAARQKNKKTIDTFDINNIRMGCKPYNTKAHRAELFRFSDWDKKFVVKKDKNTPKHVLTAMRAFNKTKAPLLCPDSKGNLKWITQQPDSYRVIVLHKNATLTGNDKVHYQDQFPFVFYPQIDENHEEAIAKLERQIRIIDFNRDIRHLLPTGPKVVKETAKPTQPLNLPSWEKLYPVWDKPKTPLSYDCTESKTSQSPPKELNMEVAPNLSLKVDNKPILVKNSTTPVVEQNQIQHPECGCAHFLNKEKYTVVYDDIVNVTDGTIIHNVGSDFTCGKGVALAISKKWEMKTHYKVPLGAIDVQTSTDTKVRVISMSVKPRSSIPGNNAKTLYLANMLECIEEVMKITSPDEPIYIPYLIGCGLDGMVKEDIEAILDILPNHITIYCNNKLARSTRSERRKKTKVVISLQRAVSNLETKRKAVSSDEDEEDISFDFSKPAPSVPVKKPKPIRSWPQKLRKEKSFIEVTKPTAEPDATCVSTVPVPKPKTTGLKEEKENRKWVRENLSRFPFKVIGQFFKLHKNPPKPADRSIKNMNLWKTGIIKAQRERELALYEWSKQPGNKLIKTTKESPPSLPVPKKIWKEGEWSGPVELEYIPSFSWALSPNSPYQGKPSVVSLNKLMEESRKATIKKLADEKREAAMADARKKAEALEAKRIASKQRKIEKKPKEILDLFKVEEEIDYTKLLKESVVVDLPIQQSTFTSGEINYKEHEAIVVEPEVSTFEIIQAEEQILTRERALELENAQLKADLASMKDQLTALTEQIANLTSMLAQSLKDKN